MTCCLAFHFAVSPVRGSSSSTTGFVTRTIRPAATNTLYFQEIEMALNTTVMRELQRELEGLKSYRTNVEARIDALQCILESGAVSLTNGKARSRGVLSADTPTHRPSLRANILRTLQQMAKATPSELTGRLQQDGVQVGGSTSLRERVWHELSRLRRRGFVRRTRGGHYKPCQMKSSAKLVGPNPSNSKSEIAAVN